MTQETDHQNNQANSSETTGLNQVQIGLIAGFCSLGAIIILILFLYFFNKRFNSNQSPDAAESSRSINYLADKRPITTVESEKVQGNHNQNDQLNKQQTYLSQDEQQRHVNKEGQEQGKIQTQNIEIKENLSRQKLVNQQESNQRSLQVNEIIFDSVRDSLVSKDLKEKDEENQNNFILKSSLPPAQDPFFYKNPVNEEGNYKSLVSEFSKKKIDIKLNQQDSVTHQLMNGQISQLESPMMFENYVSDGNQNSALMKPQQRLDNKEKYNSLALGKIEQKLNREESLDLQNESEYDDENQFVSQQIEINARTTSIILNTEGRQSKLQHGLQRDNTGSYFGEILNEQVVAKYKLFEKTLPDGVKGSKYFTSLDSRPQLPWLLPEGFSVPIYKILGKFIKADLSRISLPVAICEPSTTLQRPCEQAIGIYLIHDVTPKPQGEIGYSEESVETRCRRVAHIAVYQAVYYAYNQTRCKKSFNPILGETYELLMKDFRYFAEQVSHHPPISAFHIQTEGWESFANTDVKQTFQFGGGKGQLQFEQKGTIDCYFNSIDERIIVTKPIIYVKNLIIGELWIDIGGNQLARTMNTKEECFIEFKQRSWTKDSHLTGFVTDGQGNKVYELSGTWRSEVFIKDLKTGETTSLWKMQEMAPDIMRNFGFNKFAIQQNYIPEELDKLFRWSKEEARRNGDDENPLAQYKGILPPTDSRFRGDLRYFEQGQIDEADEEKIRLEVKQRVMRAQREKQGVVYKPAFFDIIERACPLTGEKEQVYIPKTGKDSYWSHRLKKDWKKSADIF